LFDGSDFAETQSGTVGANVAFDQSQRNPINFVLRMHL